MNCTPIGQNQYEIHAQTTRDEIIPICPSEHHGLALFNKAFIPILRKPSSALWRICDQHMLTNMTVPEMEQASTLCLQSKTSCNVSSNNAPNAKTGLLKPFCQLCAFGGDEIAKALTMTSTEILKS